MLKNKAANIVVLKGVKNGEATCVAIMLEPSGSCRISGNATLLKIKSENGAIQRNNSKTQLPALSNLERSSTR